MKKRGFRCLVAAIWIMIMSSWTWAMPRMLVPGGSTVGIKLYSKGVVVTGFELDSAAKEAGLKKGDVVLAVDGELLHTIQSLRESLNEDRVTLTVLRKGKKERIVVEPDVTGEGRKIGAYVRDSVAGIGTVTYYDPETGAFGALGHGVNDMDADILLPLDAGVVVSSSVIEVKKGKIGEPGELKGAFDVHKILGPVEHNTDLGIFGKMKEPMSGEPLPVAQVTEIRTGPASILSNVEGTNVQTYSVEILKIYPHNGGSGKDMLIRVTDENLLAQTGGIVQGMSGSPIIQDGKLIGAVTHVLVDNPTKGYGIFIENMLKTAGSMVEEQFKEVS